ncbi:MAG: LysR family transcriptional regulator [Crocinitomicaceae bacterium]|nr:LysR family transcriptional regulator [Crocinitomicaceae bacterium]
MSKKSTIRLRLWIDKNDEPFIGPGRVKLLENILAFGSISRAAKEVNMSYRKAWQLIEDMNKVSKKALVEKKTGGLTGGGATVTDEGMEIIRQYRLLQGEVDKVMSKMAKKMVF